MRAGTKPLYVARISRSHPGRYAEAKLNARFKAVSKLPPVECPVCGHKDNAWEEREGLCLDCWCTAWCIITDAAPADNKPKLKEVQNAIHKIMFSPQLLKEFSAKIKARRQQRRKKEEEGVL